MKDIALDTNIGIPKTPSVPSRRVGIDSHPSGRNAWGKM